MRSVRGGHTGQLVRAPSARLPARVRRRWPHSRVTRSQTTGSISASVLQVAADAGPEHVHQAGAVGVEDVAVGFQAGADLASLAPPMPDSADSDVDVALADLDAHQSSVPPRGR